MKDFREFLKEEYRDCRLCFTDGKNDKTDIGYAMLDNYNYICLYPKPIDDLHLTTDRLFEHPNKNYISDTALYELIKDLRMISDIAHMNDRHIQKVIDQIKKMNGHSNSNEMLANILNDLGFMDIKSNLDKCIETTYELSMLVNDLERKYRLSMPIYDKDILKEYKL